MPSSINDNPSFPTPTLYKTLPLPLHCLFTRHPLPSIRASTPLSPSLTSTITSLPNMRPGVLAGLHLLNDDLESAHAVCRANEGDGACDAWHGTLHRREGDYRNSREWIKDLKQPYLTILTSIKGAEEARQDMREFLAACEELQDGRSEGEKLEKRQYDEMRALCEWEIRKSE